MTLVEPSEKNETPATRELSAREVDFRLFQHAGPVRSLEQAAAERGQQPEQVVRSILFRLADAGEGPGRPSTPSLSFPSFSKTEPTTKSGCVYSSL